MNSPSEQELGAAFRDLVAEQPFTPDVLAIVDGAQQGLVLIDLGTISFAHAPYF